MSKKLKGILLASTFGASLLGIASCSGSSASSATLEAAYSSPAVLTYNNMRPTYNYYLTTYSFQELEVYSDSTYVLRVISSQFSAVILPEEGNEATGNERTNYITSYYGNIESNVADDLDPKMKTLTLSLATRIVSAYDSTYYIDTDNWTDEMKENSAEVTYSYDTSTGQQTETGRTEYSTGKEYLDAHNFQSSLTAEVDDNKYALTTITIE